MKESKYSQFKVSSPVQNCFLFDGLFGMIGDMWAQNRASNTEYNISKENLKYQKERNEIEDARYEEELGYNRAWAEEERDYNRALQQQIFDREDTALERQASQMADLGINPISQQMNGLGAGQAVGSATPPAGSERGGTALHNDYSPDEHLNNMITPLLSLANGVNNIFTAGFQRDKLREEADYQRLKNQEQELINKRKEKQLEQEEEQREENLRHSKENNPNIEKDTKASAERNQRENEYQERFGVQDNTDRFVRLATDTANQAGRAGEFVEDSVKKATHPVLEELSDKAKQGLESYNKATKKASDWIFDKSRKVKDWFKRHTTREPGNW